MHLNDFAIENALWDHDLDLTLDIIFKKKNGAYVKQLVVVDKS